MIWIVLKSANLVEILQIASFYIKTMFARRIFNDSKIKTQNFVLK